MIDITEGTVNNLMKTTGTPCRRCIHRNKQNYENPCYCCISNEDIALAHINPNYPVDFVYYEEDGYMKKEINSTCETETTTRS